MSCSLYFHIPFCKHKCDYCHFYVLQENEKKKSELLEAFKIEWDMRCPFFSDKKIASIYFGGGTPSLFGPERIQILLELIKQNCQLSSDVEITLEANPENLSLDLMKNYASVGINRVSVGIQALNDDLLKILGRTHAASTAIDSIFTAQQAGISNVSIDLMYDLPHQTLSHWRSTVDQILKLPITHLSLYNLTFEPQTLFFKKQDILRPFIPNEEESLEMYQLLVNRLQCKGLQQYEISAFAKEGYHSKHNVGYWTGRPFIGFGPSAFSYWEKKRFRNISHFNQYCNLLSQGRIPTDFEEQLEEKAHIRELLVIQLRLISGVDIEEFERKNGHLEEQTKETLTQLSCKGWVEWKGSLLTLTKQGLLFYDIIASELI